MDPVRCYGSQDLGLVGGFSASPKINLKSYEHQKQYKELVLQAVKQDGLQLKDADPFFYQDFDIVYAAVTNNGMALQHASAPLQNNLVIVNAAVQNNGMALQYASEQLRAYFPTIGLALKNDPSALKYVDSSARESNKEEIIKLLNKSSMPTASLKKIFNLE